jgi:glycosyltransferase involved in cell wall biosynthesis
MEEKDFEACRRRFLWLSSGGLVHKGLDLVLDVFAEMPDCHLTVCAPIDAEPDFQAAYYKKLYQTPNIRTLGWVDTASARFAEIVGGCIALVFPSCSEGQSGSVVTCLHAGLIPIISYECGVDVGEFGWILKECSINEIKTSLGEISSLSGGELKRRARQAWEHARANHTREKFAWEYQKIISTIIAASRPGASGVGPGSGQVGSALGQGGSGQVGNSS